MANPLTCDACGAREGDRPIHALKPADPQHKGGTLTLCEPCVEAKTKRVWEGRGGEEMKTALSQHELDYRQYLYVVEDEDRDMVRLLRVDHDWVEQHLAR